MKKSQNAEGAESARSHIKSWFIPFNEGIYPKLPDPLRSICELIDIHHERDMFFLSSLPVCAAHMVDVFGHHRDGKYSPDIFTLIVAPPASGKGIMSLSKKLGRSLQKEKTKDVDSKSTLFIPANISSRALHDVLSMNHQRGLIFEQEIDTLITAVEQDWGNFSDIIRKAFHHESISIGRKDTLFYIEDPKLSICLSGTPDQFLKLFPSAENGLYSRFALYMVNPDRVWKSARPSDNSRKLEHIVTNANQELYELHSLLQSRSTHLTIELTAPQWDQIDQKCEQIMSYFSEKGLDEVLHASNNRMPVIILRIVMILTILRLNEEDRDALSSKDTLNPSDIDVTIALDIATTLTRHYVGLARVIKKQSKKNFSSSIQRDFHNALPEKFETKKAISIGEKLGIKTRTVKGWLSKRYTRLKHGLYSRDN